jgi:predicted nucleic acid-binding protein
VLLAKGLKAQTLDTLIAQFCIDSETPLLTLDSDFRHFATHCGLKLV